MQASAKPIAALPFAFESPSASFVLDWATIRTMRERGIAFATVTLASGISSTGDPELDRRLPLDEPYRIPESTASAIRRARLAGGRIIAIGTTVVRALEHAAGIDGVVTACDGIADQRLGPNSRLRVVDSILSGTHEPDSSHYQLLRAFANDDTLAVANEVLEREGYQTHEFGDSVLIEKQDDDSALATTINAEFAELAETLDAAPQLERSLRSRHSTQRSSLRSLWTQSFGLASAKHAKPQPQVDGECQEFRVWGGLTS